MTRATRSIWILAAAALVLAALQAWPPAAAAASKKAKKSRKKSSRVFYLPKPTGDVQEDLDKLFSQKLGRMGRWGMAVVSLEDGELVYQHNSEQKFIPASNAKLFTTAAALEKLGPDYTYQTDLYACGGMDTSGLLHGNLVVRGSGDPTINRWDMLLGWADSLAAYGLTAVEGDVVGDDGNFVPEKIVSMVPRSSNRLVKRKKRMAWNISGLSFRDNLVAVTVSGGGLGKPLRVSTDPPREVQVRNLSRTIKGSASTVARKVKQKDGTYVTKTRKVYNVGRPYVAFDGRTLKVTGTLAQGSSKRFLFTAKQPDDHFARVLAAALRARGIELRGSPKGSGTEAVQPADSAWLIYTHSSQPLSEIIKVVNKNSHNLYAETILKTLGSEGNGRGSVEQGAEVERDVVLEMGLGEVELFDGCGLSRRNEVSPLQVVTLLRYMHQQPYWAAFYNSLAIGGVDGTLGGRLGNPDMCGRVYAKTGSIGGVSALSGYITAKSGRMFAFSIMVNNMSRAKAARRVEDYICRLLVEYLG
jgi:D-alanyl-D-alanine carboxypeptidase/D-alanyl-D-alanine-endopeptidase (penicillin-binding protein 4)